MSGFASATSHMTAALLGLCRARVITGRECVLDRQPDTKPDCPLAAYGKGLVQGECGLGVG